MENKNEKHAEGCGSSCGCGDSGGRGCGWYHGSRHHGSRWIFILIALVVVFWMGVKLGELKGLVEQGFYGYRMMGRYGSGYSGNYMGPGMMGAWRWDSGSASSSQQ